MVGGIGKYNYMPRDLFTDKLIRVIPYDKTGSFLRGLVEISNIKDDSVWSGEIQISDTRFAIWRANSKNGLSEIEIFNVIAVLKAKIQFLRGETDVTTVDLGAITSFDENADSSYEKYQKALEGELQALIDGVKLPDKMVAKVLDWSINDISILSSTASSDPINFASSGYSIFLVSLMDIWGAIFNDRFGARGYECSNIGHILRKLRPLRSNSAYIYTGPQQNDLVDRLRNNLVHNYGLRVLLTGQNEDWPSIDSFGRDPAINFDDQSKRWHMDCITVGNDLKDMVKLWVKTTRPGAVPLSSRINQ